MGIWGIHISDILLRNLCDGILRQVWNIRCNSRVCILCRTAIGVCGYDHYRTDNDPGEVAGKVFEDMCRSESGLAKGNREEITHGKNILCRGIKKPLH